MSARQKNSGPRPLFYTIPIESHRVSQPKLDLILTRKALLLALQTLGMALDRGSALALAGLARFFEEFATAYFGHDAGFFATALETTQGDFKRLVLFYAYARH